ncbi:MAG: hypothetical protein P8O06_02930 [Porticoccaceae bacterium]|nr:hypothetical protein [Porticoccaceae bacterium]
MPTGVTFPFRRIEELRHKPCDERKANGMLTSVYHLFSNANVSVLSTHSNLTIMAPLTPGSTKMVTYLMTNPSVEGKSIILEDAERDAQFVTESG